MIFCTLNLREISCDGRLKLRCAGVGEFDVFSGLGKYKNNPNYYMEKNGPIPPGVYWIVDRPTGGIGSWLKQVEKEWRTGNHYDDWFALYKDDGLINDYTIVVFKSFIGYGKQEELTDVHALINNSSPFDDWQSEYHYQDGYRLKEKSKPYVGVYEPPFTYKTRTRSSFRLHPLRPDGTGVSDGCITFYNQQDYDRLRYNLLMAHKHPINSGQLEAYGQITVKGN